MTVHPVPPPTSSAWTIRLGDDFTYHTHCPVLGCGARDRIYEVDRATRWNRLTLEADGLTAVAHLGDYDYDSAGGWICGECLTEFDGAPEGFEVLDWY